MSASTSGQPDFFDYCLFMGLIDSFWVERVQSQPPEMDDATASLSGYCPSDNSTVVVLIENLKQELCWKYHSACRVRFIYLLLTFYPVDLLVLNRRGERERERGTAPYSVSTSYRWFDSAVWLLNGHLKLELCWRYRPWCQMSSSFWIEAPHQVDWLDWRWVDRTAARARHCYLTHSCDCKVSALIFKCGLCTNFVE